MQAAQLSKIDLLMAIVFKILYKIQHSNIAAAYYVLLPTENFFEWLAFCVTIFFFINVVLVFLYWSYPQKSMVIDWGALFQLARARSQMRKTF